LLPAVVIPTAVAIGLLGVQAAFATADVCGVSSAKANDLMALSSANGIRDWIPPGVACSSDDPDYTSPLCQWRTTITQDRMIGDHRLIVASSAQPPQKAMDYVFVFACVDGRPTPTTHTRRDPDLKLDYAQYAQGGEALELDRPTEFQAKAPAADGGGIGCRRGRKRTTSCHQGESQHASAARGSMRPGAKRRYQHLADHSNERLARPRLLPGH